MIRVTLALVLIVAAARVGDARAQEGEYPWDLAKKHPQAAAALQKILPSRLRSVAWVYRLNGTASEMTTVTVQNKPSLGGMVCKPHDCGDNKFAFLVAVDGSHAAAALRSRDLSSGKTQFFGAPSPDEQKILSGYLE